MLVKWTNHLDLLRMREHYFSEMFTYEEKLLFVIDNAQFQSVVCRGGLYPFSDKQQAFKVENGVQK